MTENHREEVVEIQLSSSTKLLYSLRTLTRTLAESMGYGTKESENTALAVEEAVSNVIEHGYHGEPRHRIRIRFEMEGKKFVVRIMHSGDHLDISHVPSGDLANFYKQKKKGGLGIVIMRKFMDEVSYKSGSRQNECCMVKYLKK